MKRISILLFVLIVLSPTLFAQRTAANWGNRILFGPTFVKTDSLKLVKASLTDSVMADTIYSEVLSIPDWIDGIWSIDLYFTGIGGGSDSLVLEYRRATTIRDNNTNTNYTKFGQWQNILSSMKADTLYSIGIAQSDSSWWKGGNGRQFRLYDTSVTTDTTTHLITDFLR